MTTKTRLSLHCDRCGKSEELVHDGQTNAWSKLTACHQNGPFQAGNIKQVVTDGGIDLCPSCTQALHLFLVNNRDIQLFASGPPWYR
jgi:hypothetical protein